MRHEFARMRSKVVPFEHIRQGHGTIIVSCEDLRVAWERAVIAPGHIAWEGRNCPRISLQLFFWKWPDNECHFCWPPWRISAVSRCVMGWYQPAPTRSRLVSVKRVPSELSHLHTCPTSEAARTTGYFFVLIQFFVSAGIMAVRTLSAKVRKMGCDHLPVWPWIRPVLANDNKPHRLSILLLQSPHSKSRTHSCPETPTFQESLCIGFCELY